MYHDSNFRDVLAGPAKAAWQVEDVLPAGAELAECGEARHIDLFRLFHQRFTEAFGTPCEAIGPAGATAAESIPCRSL
jgi:hypothetical protein